MAETNLEKFRRKAIEKQFRDALKNQKLVLDDGSGQMVGVYDQSTGKEMNTEMNQKAEKKRQVSIDTDEEKNRRMKKLAETKRVTQQLQAEKTPDILGKPQTQQKQKTTQSMSDRDAAVMSGIASGMSTGTGTASSTDAPPPSGSQQALNSAMQAGVATGGNPYAMAGAAAIGLLQAEEQRKQYKQKKLEEAKIAKAESKEAESKIYMQLASSLRGILS
tara:strand:- start:109 stop:765 length:657 start_codon:yes stop_codon:yes gene_type:complete